MRINTIFFIKPLQPPQASSASGAYVQARSRPRIQAIRRGRAVRDGAWPGTAAGALRLVVVYHHPVRFAIGCIFLFPRLAAAQNSPVFMPDILAIPEGF